MGLIPEKNAPPGQVVQSVLPAVLSDQDGCPGKTGHRRSQQSHPQTNVRTVSRLGVGILHGGQHPEGGRSIAVLKFHLQPMLTQIQRLQAAIFQGDPAFFPKGIGTGIQLFAIDADSGNMAGVRIDCKDQMLSAVPVPPAAATNGELIVRSLRLGLLLRLRRLLRLRGLFRFGGLLRLGGLLRFGGLLRLGGLLRFRGLFRFGGLFRRDRSYKCKCRQHRT